MPFYCAFHPWMRGLLVVVPAAGASLDRAATDPGLLLARDGLAALA